MKEKLDKQEFENNKIKVRLLNGYTLFSKENFKNNDFKDLN